MLTKTKRGFSLVELLVALAILIILAALLLGVIGSFRSQAKNVTCANNLHQIALAMQNYAMDNKNLFPRSVNNAGVPIWIEDTQPYLSTSKTFICPANSNPYLFNLVSPSDPGGNQATFSPTVMVQDGTITITRLRGSYEYWFNLNGPTAAIPTPDGPHYFAMDLKIPSLGYTANVTNNHNLNWSTLTPTKTFNPGGNFMASDVQIWITMVGGEPWTSPTLRNTQNWQGNMLNPFTNMFTGYYTAWGVVYSPDTIAYAHSIGQSELWFDKGSGIPLNPATRPEDATILANPEAWFIARVNNQTLLTRPRDFAFTVSVKGSNIVNGSNGAGDLVAEKLKDVKWWTSYGYNSQLNSRQRQSVQSDCIVVMDYNLIVCDPTSDSVSNLPPRHSGKRLNVVRMDGRVEAVTLSDILQNGNTFKPSAWIP